MFETTAAYSMISFIVPFQLISPDLAASLLEEISEGPHRCCPVPTIGHWKDVEAQTSCLLHRNQIVAPLLRGLQVRVEFSFRRRRRR